MHAADRRSHESLHPRRKYFARVFLSTCNETKKTIEKRRFLCLRTFEQSTVIHQEKMFQETKNLCQKQQQQYHKPLSHILDYSIRQILQSSRRGETTNNNIKVYKRKHLSEVKGKDNADIIRKSSVSCTSTTNFIMTKLSRVLFPDDHGCGGVVVTTTNAGHSKQRKQQDNLATNQSQRAATAETSCLTQLAGPDLPLSLSCSSSSSSRETKRKPTKKRRRAKRERQGNTIMEKENQNPFSETNIQTTSKDHGNRNQGKTNNGTTKRSSRIASEGMDILGSIGNLAFQTFSMINDRNQRGKKGDKNQKTKKAKTKKNASKKKGKKINRVSLDGGEGNTTKSSSKDDANYPHSPSIAPKPSKRKDTKETPVQIQLSKAKMIYECDESLDNIIWHGVSAVLSKKKQRRISSNKKNQIRNTQRSQRKTSQTTGDSKNNPLHHKIKSSTTENNNINELPSSSANNITPSDENRIMSEKLKFNKDYNTIGSDDETKSRRNQRETNEITPAQRLIDEKSLDATQDKCLRHEQTLSPVHPSKIPLKECPKNEIQIECDNHHNVVHRQVVRRSTRSRRPIKRFINATKSCKKGNTIDEPSKARRSSRKRMLTERYSDIQNCVQKTGELDRNVKRESNDEGTTALFNMDMISSDTNTSGEKTTNKSKRTNRSSIRASRTTETKEDMPTHHPKQHELCISNTHSSSSNDKMNMLEWDEGSIELLLKAHKTTDPRCFFFWQQVSSKVPNRSPEDCRDKWFALVKTPKIRRKKPIKQEYVVANYHNEEDDDIFNSTPLRNAAKVILSFRKSSNTRSSRGRKGSIDTFSDILTSPMLKSHRSAKFLDLESHLSPLIQAQPMYKGYMKRGRKGVINRKTSKLNQSVTFKTSKTQTKKMSAKIEVGDVHMNCFLSPNGTVVVNAPEEHEVEDLYFPSNCEDYLLVESK